MSARDEILAKARAGIEGRAEALAAYERAVGTAKRLHHAARREHAGKGGKPGDLVWHLARGARLYWSGLSALRLAARMVPTIEALIGRTPADALAEGGAVQLALAGATGVLRRADAHAAWASAAAENFAEIARAPLPRQLLPIAQEIDGERAISQAYAILPDGLGGIGLEPVKDEIWTLLRQAGLVAGFLRKESEWLRREQAGVAAAEAPKPKNEAERVRNMRARRKAGFRHRVSFDLHERDVRALIRLGFIRDGSDKAEIEDGLRAFLQSSLAMAEIDEDVRDVPEFSERALSYL